MNRRQLFGLAATACLMLAAASGMAQQKRISPMDVTGTVVDGDRVTIWYSRPYTKDPMTGEMRKMLGAFFVLFSAAPAFAAEMDIVDTAVAAKFNTLVAAVKSPSHLIGELRVPFELIEGGGEPSRRLRDRNPSPAGRRPPAGRP